jgi:Helicase HerA, central domain
VEPLSINRATDQPAGHLDLTGGPLVGRVARLDSRRIQVDIFDRALISRVTVSDLVALPVGDSYLIGLVDGLTGGTTSSLEIAVDHENSMDEPLAQLQIMPIGTLTPDYETDSAVFRRGASVYPHIYGSCYLIEGERLHRFMSVLAEGVAPGERLVLGRYVADREAFAVADGNRLFQRHLALLGATGAGKSWAVAKILERAARLGHANLIVFDLHREYGPLTDPNGSDAPIAHGMRVAGPADSGGNKDELLYLPYWLLERDELVALVVNPTDPHASDQALLLTDHVQTLKRASLREAGEEEGVDTSTVDSPIPYRLDHLIEWLKRDDTERIPHHPSGRVEPGPYYGRMTGLISRLEARTADPRYAFMFDPPPFTLSYAWLTDTVTKLLKAGPGESGIKIIDLSEVPSVILPVVAGVLARLVYDVQFWMERSQRTPICIVCDEAHLYLPLPEDTRPIHKAALMAFEAIAKEGRKYGVALLVVSQRPFDVSRTVLSQCNNFIIMRVTSDRDRELIERLIPETLSSVMDVLPALDVGEAVMVGDALLVPTRIKFDPPVLKPASATQPYWSLWSSQPSSREAITAGVEAFRKQLRRGD